jgi:tetratricopeptide (TPR) repeat protein
MNSLAAEIERLRGVLSENPRSLHFARLAEYLLQADDVDEAIKVCQDGVEHHTQYANAHFVLGKCHFQKGDLDAAESEFNKALLYDPEHLNAHHYQAKIMKERDWQNAYVLWLKRALAIDSMDSLAKSMLDEFEEGKGVGEDLAQEEVGVVVEEEAASGAEALDQLTEVEKTFSDESEEVETITPEEKAVEEMPELTSEGEVETEGVTVEPGEKRYEFILDDIFKEESTEEERVAEGKEDISEVSEQVVEEPLEEEEEAVETATESIEEAAVESMETEVEAQEEPEREISVEEKERVADEIFGDEGDVEDEDYLEEDEEIEEPHEDVATEEAAPEEEPDVVEEVLTEEETAVEEQPPEETEAAPQKEPFVTATLGEIYAAQGHYGKAIGVYEILLRKDPDNVQYKAKVEELKKKMEDEQQG